MSLMHQTDNGIRKKYYPSLKGRNDSAKLKAKDKIELDLENFYTFALPFKDE